MNAYLVSIGSDRPIPFSIHKILNIMFYMKSTFRARCPKMEREKAFAAFIGKFPIRGHAPRYRVPKAITETRK